MKKKQVRTIALIIKSGESSFMMNRMDEALNFWIFLNAWSPQRQETSIFGRELADLCVELAFKVKASRNLKTVRNWESDSSD